MRKRRIYLGLLLLVIAIGAIVVCFKPEREPEYEGRKLSEWVMPYSGHGSPTLDTAQIDDAIRHIGTNGIPYLLKWISYDIAPWKVKLYQGLPRFLRRPFNGWQRKDALAMFASGAFGKLGPDARAAVPELIRLLNDSTRNYSAGRAALALGNLGDGYLPALLAALTNRQTDIRGSIMIGISSMGTNGRPAVPALTNFLNDPNPAVSRIAKAVLSRIDPETLRTNAAQ